MCVHALSPVLLLDPLGYSPQASLSMGFCRQVHWSGLLCLSPGDLFDLGIEPTSLVSPASAGSFFSTSTWEEIKYLMIKST